MGITPSYPGIYIQELPSTAHTITAAPTSVTVFVGYTHPFQTAKFGAPTELFSFSDYERLFGGTYQSDLIDCNVANAVNQFFLNGGSDAFVVGIQPAQYTDNQGDANSNNVTTKGAVTAATLEFGANPNGIVFTALEPVDSVPMTVTISNPQTSHAPVSITKITEAAAVATVTLATGIPNIAANDSITISGNSVPGYNGSWTVVHVNSPTEFTFNAAASGLADGVGGTAADNTLHAADIDTADIAISYGNQTETYRKLNLVPSDPNFIATRIGGTVVVSINAIVRANNIVTVTTSVNHGFEVGNTIAIAGVNDASFDGSFVVASVLAASFTYLQSAANAGSNGGTASKTISPASSLVTVSPDTAYPTAYPFPAHNSTMSVTTTFIAPGGAVGVFNPADFAPVFQADSPLDKLQIFNLMLIPGIINSAVLSEAIAFCERKYAFFIMDPPSIDVADPPTNWVGDFLNNPSGDTAGNVAPRSINGALYFPYLKASDPITGDALDLPPSGFVAGIYALTDQNRGVWKAPAGLETIIPTTTGVVPKGVMTDPRQGVLNVGAVNCLRTFPNVGTVVFGARTLVGQTANPTFQQWRYVPVRRMALFIEQTLRANLTWVIFEPNDEPLWTSIRSSINSFMLSLFNQGAFQGSKPSLAFQVLCDSTTTTQDDINNGIVNIVVAFAPLKPAEFVIIKIAQLAGQAQA